MSRTASQRRPGMRLHTQRVAPEEVTPRNSMAVTTLHAKVVIVRDLRHRRVVGIAMFDVTLLLSTELQTPPSRSAVIVRSRPSARLAEGLTRPVTLISAPAGFGKTTLVSAWLVECGCQAAWLSLDKGDRDPVRFFAHRLVALQAVDPALGRGVQPLLTAQPPLLLDALDAALSAELPTMPGSTILILDDYHRIPGDAVHGALRFLVEHQPANLRLMLLSREDPPQPPQDAT